MYRIVKQGQHRGYSVYVVVAEYIYSLQCQSTGHVAVCCILYLACQCPSCIHRKECLISHQQLYPCPCDAPTLTNTSGASQILIFLTFFLLQVAPGKVCGGGSVDPNPSGRASLRPSPSLFPSPHLHVPRLAPHALSQSSHLCSLRHGCSQQGP